MTGRVWLIVVGATAFAMLAGLLVWAGTSRGCGDTLTLTVAAAPEITPAVREAAQRWSRTDPEASGRCVAVRVSGADPARLAAAIAAQHRDQLDVAGVEPSGIELPQVWIPDAATWVTRVRGVERKAVSAEPPSIAVSPVVLALPEPDARAEGWPSTRIGWDYVMAGMKARPPLPVAVLEPRRSAAGLSGLLATGELARSAANLAGTDPETAVLGTYRGLSLTRATTVDELFGRLPRGADAPGQIRAALLPEYAVRAYDATRPAVPLAAIYPEPAAPALDYPYATLAGLSPAETDAARQFRGWLLGKDTGTVLARRGFRTPDGAIGAGFPTDGGLSPESVRPPRPVDTETVETALTWWTEVSLASRVLAVIDVSGSMDEPVPTAGGLSRLEVTRRAAASGLKLFTDDSQLGLWVFSTGLDGEKDYRELVPVGPLSSTRTKITAALGGAATKTGGGTGLYDTVAAGYARMTAEYDPELSNTLVVMTDGVNEDPSGITRDALVRRLGELSDPAKPVHVVILGIGPEVDKHELETVTAATGGAVFVATDPSEIGEIFLKALALPSR
ncbi:MAG: substrate-binding domain-containing protein [Micromonosporaceae bacterium]